MDLHILATVGDVAIRHHVKCVHLALGLEIPKGLLDRLVKGSSILLPSTREARDKWGLNYIAAFRR